MGIFTKNPPKWKREEMKNEVAAERVQISTNSTAQEIADFFGVKTDNEQLKSATFYACMQIRCNSIAKLPLKVLRTDGDSTVAELKHPLYGLLHDRPNPYMTNHDFLWATEYLRLSTGNAFWYPIRDRRGTVKSIYLLPQGSVSIMIDDEGITDAEHKIFYQYTDPKLGVMTLFQEEVCHFKNFCVNGYSGTGIAEYLGHIIQNEKLSTEIMEKKYSSGLSDPIIVQYVGDLNDSKKQAIVNKFARLGGTSNAGKVLPIPPDYKISQLETKLVNNQFFELQGLTTRHIANAFGVKSFQLNDLEKSTYTNIENQNRAYYSDTLINVLREYEQEIKFKLFSTKEKRDGYFAQFNVDSFLRSDPATRYSTYQTAISAGVMTPAEARKMEDMPFVEGSDQLIYGNGAAIPLEKIGIQYGDDPTEGSEPPENEKGGE